MMKRLTWLSLILIVSLGWAGEKPVEVTVAKNPGCGCCSKWVNYMKNNGFDVRVDTTNSVVFYKSKYKISRELSSCHTAVVEGYVIEGHVPAEDIRRLLKEKPDIRGLTVPGMVVGSPGMEQGNRKNSYDVLAIKKDGSTYIYHSYKGN